MGKCTRGFRRGGHPSNEGKDPMLCRGSWCGIWTGQARPNSPWIQSRRGSRCSSQILPQRLERPAPGPCPWAGRPSALCPCSCGQARRLHFFAPHRHGGSDQDRFCCSHPRASAGLGQPRSIHLPGGPMPGGGVFPWDPPRRFRGRTHLHLGTNFRAHTRLPSRHRTPPRWATCSLCLSAPDRAVGPTSLVPPLESGLC